MSSRVNRAAQVFAATIVAATLGLSAVDASAEVGLWDAPDLDWLAYVNASGAGNRAFAGSWIGGLDIDPATGDFVPESGQEPSRLGMPLVAFDTSSRVAPGLPANRYNVASATLTMTMASATFPGASLYYDDQPEPRAEILADVASGDIDSQRPIELYGVGFRDGYVGFEFTTPPSDPTLLDERTHIYASSDGVYLAYPIASDAAGQPLDVTNSLTGGFSATAPGNVTEPFDPTPWAIGAAELAVGAAVPDDTTFTFAVELAEPGVREYLQQGLADGGLGFFISSLTLATQPGEGVFPYPQWYLRESQGGAVGGTPPTLTLDVSIADAPGDFNGDGAVDAADLQQWQMRFGAEGEDLLAGADFLQWQRNFVGAAGATAVPEPSALLLAIVGVAVHQAFERKRFRSIRSNSTQRNSLEQKRAERAE